MATSLKSLSKHLPRRAISLPPREHPISLKFEVLLNHLKTWQALSAAEISPFSVENIRIGLVGFSELYNCVEQIILTPHARQAISQYQNGKFVEELLDNSVTLLDACGVVKDILMILKEQIRDLESVFRRKSGNLSIESYIHAYISSRKKMQKDIAKCTSALKKLESRVSCSVSFNTDQHVSMGTRVLKETSIVTICIFRLILSFLSVSEIKTKGGWSLVSKLISLRSFSSDKEGKIINEIKNLDVSLLALKLKMKCGDFRTDGMKMQTLLRSVNFSIDSLESELECVSKCLVQNRASLLNISTQ